MFRRTKIVSTLGPATDEPGILEKLICAGVNVVRMNFSHGSPEDHKARAEKIREYAAKHNKFVAILGDLQGPKIRIARFAEGPITLKIGDHFRLDASLPRDVGNREQVGIDYKDLPNDVIPGDILLLDDGRVVLKVLSVEGAAINTVVEVGGRLSNNKGINRQGGGLTAPALTEKDKQDILTAVEIGVDYLAVSFPRSAEDINYARQLVKNAGGHAYMVAKIERAEAVLDLKVLDEIILASDAVMVARGDLGVEIGDAELIGVQKHIISRARSLNRCVITATQMMDSMIENPLPTRAEVFDVANAVLDGTDAVMLSAETAAGKYPVQTVEAMVRVILGAEKQTRFETIHRTERCKAIDQSIALATMYTAAHLDGVKGIAALTESGSTPLLMSRCASQLPIFAFSHDPATLRRAALFRGVQTVLFDNRSIPSAEINRQAISVLREQGIVQDGDLVILSKGDFNELGGTNTMKILQVGQYIA